MGSWASDTEKAGQSAQAAEKKATGAFGKISEAVRSARTEAKKGATFGVKTEGERGLSGLVSKVRGARGEAEKGATFSVRGDERGFSGILSRIRGVRGEAGKGATMEVRGSESGFRGILSRMAGVRTDAKTGATFSVRGDQSGFAGILSRIQGVRSEAKAGATMAVGGDASGLNAAAGRIADVRADANRGATMKIDADTSALKDSLASVAETAGGVAGGMALEDVGSGMADNFREASQAAGGFEGRLGASGRQAEALAGVGRDVFAGAWGESLGEVNSAVTTVAQGLGTMDDAAKTQKLTEQALTLSDAFGMDVTESVEAARLMSQNMGISSERAFDLIAAGARRGANTSGDLLDTMREYPTYFSEMGLSGEQAMGMMAAGAERGIWNTDKLADSVKEFSIRAVDGSDLTKQGFAAAGLKADEMSRKISQGGPTAEKAFFRTVQAISSIKDPIKREKAGVALFGTQFEDLGKKSLEAMLAGQRGMRGYEGATKRTGDSLYDNFTTRVNSMVRRVQMAASDAGLGALGSALSEIAPTAGMAGMAVMGLGPAAARAAGPMGKAAAGAGRLAGGAGRAGIALAAIGWPIALAAGLGAAFFAAYRKSETFRKGVDWLGNKLIGTSNYATISKKGFKGLGQVFSDNHGLSRAWSGGLSGLKARLTDQKGISGGVSAAYGRIRKNLTDNKGASQAWQGGLSGLKRSLTDQKGISGAVQTGYRRVHGALVDNRGASGAARTAYQRLHGALVDQKGVSGAVRSGYQRVSGALADSRGASGAARTAYGKLHGALVDNKGASGAVKNALAGLRGEQGQTKTSAYKLGEGAASAYQSMKKRTGSALSEMGRTLKNRFTDNHGISSLWSKKSEDAVARNHWSMRDRASSAVGSLVSRAKKGFSDEHGLSALWTKKTEDTGAKNHWSLRDRATNALTSLRDSAKARFTDEHGLSALWTKKTEDTASRNHWNMRDRATNALISLRDSAKARLTDEHGISALWSKKSEDVVAKNHWNMRDRAGNALNALKSGASRVWDEMKSDASAFGTKLDEITGGKFSKAVNTARSWLGSLMSAVGNVLSAIGADDLAGEAKGTAKNLKEPIKFARGGIARDDRGGVLDAPVQVGGEAGREGLVPLTRTTAGGHEAMRAAAPRYGYEKVRGHRGVHPLPAGKEGRDWFGAGGGGGSYPPKAAQFRVSPQTYTADADAASAAKSAAAMWNGLVKKGPGGVHVSRSSSPLGGGRGAYATTNQTIVLGPAADAFHAGHEFGHTPLGLGHGGNGIMGGMGRTIGGPSQGDFAAITSYYGDAPGATGKGPGGGSSPSTAPYGPLKGRVHDGGAGAGQYGPTANHLWDSDTFGRVIEVLKRFRVSANTYENHPPMYGSRYAGRSADFWAHEGRGTPIPIGLNNQVRDYIKGNLSAGLGWVLSEGSDAGHSGPNRHVHATWPGQDPGTPDVKYTGGTGGGSGFDWMGLITKGLAAVAPFPQIPGMIGEGMAGYAPKLLGMAKDWLVDKATGIFGAVSRGIGGLYNNITGLTLGEAVAKGGWPGNLQRTAVGVAWEESSANAKAQNPSGARGLFQIMPYTARDLGIDYGKLYDPIYNAAAGKKVHDAQGWGAWVAYPPSGDSMNRGGTKVTDYDLGGILPGQRGKPVMVKGHSGEGILSEKQVQASRDLARSVELWSKRGTGVLQRSGEREVGGGAGGRELARQTKELKRMADRLENLEVRIGNGEELTSMALNAQDSPTGRKRHKKRNDREFAMAAERRS